MHARWTSRPPVQVTVLQAHEPGAEAEVDFGPLYAQVAGVLL